MKVLFATYNLDRGGLEEVLKTYAKLFDHKRFTLVVAYIVHGIIAEEIAKIEGVRVVHVATKSRVRRLITFIRLARSMDADIVHNHACWYGLVAGFLSGAKTVETVHNIYHWLTPRERVFYGIYCLFADRIIAVSEYVRDFTIEFFPFMNPKKMVVVHNGIEPDQFLAHYDVSDLRRQYEIPAGNVVVGFIGRLTEQKGVIYLLEALASLGQQCTNISAVIVGDGELMPVLKDRAHELGLSCVRFSGFQRDIPRFLSLMDIFVLPSLYEGLPVSVIEAMMAGKPVVATRVGGTPEAVLEGVTGFIVAPKDPQQLTDRLEYLVAHPVEREQMGASGRMRALEHFSGQSMVGKTEAIYQTLTGRS